MNLLRTSSFAPFKAASVNKEHYRGIIGSSEIWHLAEWEQEQPRCLFLLTTLSSLIKYSSDPAVPITLASTVIDYYRWVPPSRSRFLNGNYLNTRPALLFSYLDVSGALNLLLQMQFSFHEF